MVLDCWKMKNQIAKVLILKVIILSFTNQKIYKKNSIKGTFKA